MRHRYLLSGILVACTGRGDDRASSNLEACVLSNVEPVCAATPVPLTTSATVDDAPHIELDITYAATAPGGRGYVVFTPARSGTYTLYASIELIRFCDEEPTCFSTDFDCSPMNRATRYELVQGLPHEIELRDPGTFWFHLAAEQHQVDYAPAQFYEAGTTPSGLSTGELDGDQILDLVVSTPDDASGMTTVDLLKGDGSGAFAMVNQVRTSAPSETVLSDVNGDGILDIIGLAHDGQGPLPSFYLEGRGGFEFATIPASTGYDFERHLRGADFDEDGTIDVVAAYVDTTTSDGPGGFVILGLPGFTVMQDVPAFGRDTGPAVAGDFNGDGHQDVLVGNTNAGAVQLYTGDGSGRVAFAFESPLTGVGLRELAAADLDGDGLSDFVTVHDDNTIIVSFSDGAGFPAALTMQPSVVGRDIEFGDFDRDGRIDFAVSGLRGDGGGVALYLARETGFERVGILDLPTLAGGLAVADFNGDGFHDIAVATIGGIAVFESR